MTQIAFDNATKNKIKAVFSLYNLLKTAFLFLSYLFIKCFYLALFLYYLITRSELMLALEHASSSPQSPHHSSYNYANRH